MHQAFPLCVSFRFRDREVRWILEPMFVKEKKEAKFMRTYKGSSPGNNGLIKA